MSNLEIPVTESPMIAPTAALAPVAAKDRVSSVDTLRGFALLGILAMNIIAFALPMAAYMNPLLESLKPYQGPYTGLNKLSWWVMHLVFDQKMMSIFSMLFGAGLILMGGRAQTQMPERRGFAGVYYRRLLWLFLFGMIHAYLIWFGDILVSYALCGMVVYPLRRLRPKWLILIGTAFFLVTVPVNGLIGGFMIFTEKSAAEVQKLVAEGKPITEEQKEMLKGYDEFAVMMSPPKEKIDEHIAAMRGRDTVIAANAKEAATFQFMVFFLWTFWRATGLMLIGMALMKLGVFAAALSRQAYIRMAVIGYGVGFPLIIGGALLMEHHNFDPALVFALDGQFNYIGSLGVALGHVGVIMLICKTGILTTARSALAAVGRMAFTNYLMQSILMTFVFYGWGLGYYGHVERAYLYLFVLGVWALQLIISPLWLSRFRFGPAEWVWRSLTYWKPQPMLR
jgi:uncharacterized protein